MESEDCSRLESPGCDVGLRTGPHSGMCWVNRVDSKGFGNGFLSEGRSRGHLTRRSSVRNSETKQMKLIYKRNTMGFFSKIKINKICITHIKRIYKTANIPIKLAFLLKCTFFSPKINRMSSF